MKYYKEIEQMIVSARGMNEEEFDKAADEHISRIPEEEKNEYCKALAAFHSDRISQLNEVENKIASLMRPQVRKFRTKRTKMPAYT